MDEELVPPEQVLAEQYLFVCIELEVHDAVTAVDVEQEWEQAVVELQAAVAQLDSQELASRKIAIVVVRMLHLPVAVVRE